MDKNKISFPDFVEKVVDVKLSSYQKSYLKIFENPETKFIHQKGLNRDPSVYILMYLALWRDYLKDKGECNELVKRED